MFQFPFNPYAGQTFTPLAGVTYRWSGTAWHLLAGPGTFITTTDADTRYVNIDEAQNVTNRIINGRMAIDQRNAGAETNWASTNTFPVDRWSISPGGVTTLSIGRKVLVPGAYYLMVKTTAAQALAPTTEIVIRQTIEGLNLADLAYGTASASSLTLAFEVRATIAGSGTVAIRGATPLQYYVTTFPVTTNFTTVTVTVPGATIGTWEVGTGVGFYVDWGLAIGSTSTAPAPSSAWAVGAFTSAPGATNFMATINNEYHLRNVRLYKGSVDYGPDRRLYAEELALCQRYYCKSYDQATVPGTAVFPGIRIAPIPTADAAVGRLNVPVSFPVSMRAAPSITTYNAETGASGSWSPAAAALTVVHVSDLGAVVTNTNTLTGAFFFGHFTASAEL